jgi:ribosomal protein L11 methyltransferase
MNEVDGILWIQGNVNEIPKTEFDFIFANINKNVLLNDIPSYFERLSLGGTLVLSGFFSNDSQQLIQRAFEFGLHFNKENSKENWSNLVFEKK